MMDSWKLVIGSGDNYLYCIDSTGQMIWKYETDDYIHSTPLVVDIDNNGLFEIIFGSTDDIVYCLSLSGVSQSGSNPWYCHRGTVLHTGWMDSDNDIIDDLTESYLYSPKYPYTNQEEPSLPISNIGVLVVFPTIALITISSIIRN